MRVYGAQVAEVVIAPYGVEDVLTRGGNVLVVFKINQKLIFLRRQVDGFAVHTDLPAHLVDGQRTRLEYALIALMAALFNRAHARGKHDRRKWLGNIVICPQIKAKDFVIFLRACGQHHDGYFFVFGADMAQDAPAVIDRHHDIEDNQVDGVQALVDQLHCLSAVGCL